MTFLTENWFVVLALLVMLYIGISFIIHFVNSPSTDQIESLKEWLKWAVVLAERELGEKTGQLKLRMVYDMAAEKFPWIIKLISFEKFSRYVDEALTWMSKQLSSNEKICSYVNERGL